MEAASGAVGERGGGPSANGAPRTRVAGRDGLWEDPDMVRVSPPGAPPATREDLDSLPEHIKGEIIDGVLYTSPRPRFLHARLELLVGGEWIHTRG
jgi:hypothetical protein